MGRTAKSKMPTLEKATKGGKLLPAPYGSPITKILTLATAMPKRKYSNSF